MEDPIPGQRYIYGVGSSKYKSVVKVKSFNPVTQIVCLLSHYGDVQYVSLAFFRERASAKPLL